MNRPHIGTERYAFANVREALDPNAGRSRQEPHEGIGA